MGGTETSVITRPGVDGVNIRREGIKGRPFQMESGVAIAGDANARLLMDLYKQSEGTIATLTWEGILYSAEYGNTYGILHAGEFQQLRVAAAVSGTVNKSNGLWLRAVWDLIPIALSQVT